jgi:hypothetical protein
MYDRLGGRRQAIVLLLDGFEPMAREARLLSL